MNCPSCLKTVLHTRILEESLHSLECEECGGRWIHGHQYWRWLGGQGAKLQEKPFDEAVSLPVNDTTNVKICPECQHILSRWKVGHGLDFHIEHCSSCAGVWSDKNKWEMLRAMNLHDDIHFISSNAWRRELIQEEEREAHLRRVIRVIGEENYARAKDIKEWLNGHPRREAILAFISDWE